MSSPSHNRRIVRIGTRASKLAMWQAEYVKAIMEEQNQDYDFKITSMTTTGDDNLSLPLSQFANKGVFTKELDHALLNDAVDVVVHCTKDLATSLPRGIRFCAIMERESADDCVILHPKYKEQFEAHKREWEENRKAHPNQPKICPALSFLPSGAIIGTSALRRQAVLARYHPTLVCKDIRGNVLTRLEKLDRGDYDAIILAKVGIERLGLADRVSAVLETDHYLHAVGQAALAVVCRTGDDEMKDLFMQSLHNIPSALSCTVERGMLAELQGGCKVPIAVSTNIFVVPNATAMRQVGLIETYSATAKILQQAELEKIDDLLAKSPDGKPDPSNPDFCIETDPIPSHLYQGLTSLIKGNVDLRATILEQNSLVHSLDSDYEDGDDDEDEFHNSLSHSQSSFQQAIGTKLGSLNEDTPLVTINDGTNEKEEGEENFSTPVKKSLRPTAPLSIDFDSCQTRERKFSAPLTPRTQAQTWSLLVITRAAVVSMNGQNYVEAIRGEHFPLYLKSQFVNPISSKAWAVGRDLGSDLNALGAKRILDEIRAAENITTE